jgi:hypothetical protein
MSSALTTGFFVAPEQALGPEEEVLDSPGAELLREAEPFSHGFGQGQRSSKGKKMTLTRVKIGGPHRIFLQSTKLICIKAKFAEPPRFTLFI